MPVEDFTTLRTTPQISISLEPTQNAFHSMMLLMKAEKASGFSDWVRDTLENMTPEERFDHQVVMNGLYYAIMPTRSYASFPAYIDGLAASDPVALRDQMLDEYARRSLAGEPCERHDEIPEYDRAAVLSNFDAYLEFLYTRFEVEQIYVEIEHKAYQYAIDPNSMQAFIVSHLRFMWDHFLAREWQRIEPMLSDAVRAFRQLDFTNMSKLQVAQLITDQELEPWMQERVESCRNLVFIPSSHIGPYVSIYDYLNGTLGIIFSAHLPKGSHVIAPDLSRNEILVRLTALAEDNRLRILKYITDHGEQRSQDIMTALDFSQSAASRHLKQLSATGLLLERRCEGAKCYRLNDERLDETLKATRSFLLGEEAPTNRYPERIKAFA